MLKILSTLVRGAAAEAEEAVFDANALRLLAQQLRDAAAALDLSRRELARAMAHRASEQRTAESIATRIVELEQSTRHALAAGREDLAGEAAAVIAARTDDLAARKAAIERFDTDILRLSEAAETGRQRLVDLRRGLEMARAEDALRRAGANGRRALTTGSGALRDAESTLARIRESHARCDDYAEALDQLDAAASGSDLDKRLGEAGFGAATKTKAADVLDRLRASQPASPASANPTNPAKGA